MRRTVFLLASAPMAISIGSAAAAASGVSMTPGAIVVGLGDATRINTSTSADQQANVQSESRPVGRPRKPNRPTAEASPPTQNAVTSDIADPATPAPDAPVQTGGTATDQDIVVTGYRASIAGAQQIKRNSDAILDAVVAEDIGKLPDNNSIESLARIAGVQISRSGDEGNGILVRGLPNLTTTFNGRDVFTGELRGVALQDFPSGAVAGLEVYKSGTADLIEPGIAGLINVRSRRPFDFTGTEVAGGVRYTYNDQNGRKDPNGNILFTTRASTPIGEIGILVNGAYSQQTYRNAVRFNNTFIVTAGGTQVITPAAAGTGFSYPESVGVYNDSGKRWRPSINGSVQWKPAPNLEVYYDFLWQAYRGELANDFFGTSLRYLDPTLSDVVLKDGTTDQAASFTKTGGFRSDMFRSTVNNRTDTFQVAGGLKWDIGRAHLSTDLAYTRSRYQALSYSLDTAFNSAPTVQVGFDVDGGAAFSLPGFNASDPANYRWRGFYEQRFQTSGKGIQWRTDLTLDTDIDLLPKLQFGFRYTDRDAALDNGSRYAYTYELGIPLASLPLGDLSLTQDTFRNSPQGFRNWLMPSRDGIQGNIGALHTLIRQSLSQLLVRFPNDGGYLDSQRLYQTDDVQLDPLQGFRAKEASYTFYGQGKYQFDLGSVEVDGTVGARIVNTDGRYSGISNVFFDGVRTAVPRTVKQNYVDVLPNASLRVRPVQELQLRLAYTKTRTRPEFAQLNPALNISQNLSPIPEISPGVPGPADPNRPNAYGNAGNPDLAPLTSTNYDASIEWYFAKTGSITFAAFYRNLAGFIGNYTRRVNDPVYGLLEVTRPENAGTGKLKGLELNAYSFLTFLPGKLNGFGVQANATYLDGKNRLPTAIDADAPYVPILFVSKFSYNAALFYEKGKISTRLSYNSRSKFNYVYTQVTQNGGFTGLGTRPISRLDYSLNWTPIKPVTLSFDVSNILAQPFKNFNDYADGRSFPIDVRDEGRYYGLNLRFRF